MSPDEKIEKLLREVGAVRLPGRKHHKHRLPNGRTFVMAVTPSDWRTRANELSRLRRLLVLPTGR